MRRSNFERRLNLWIGRIKKALQTISCLESRRFSANAKSAREVCLLRGSGSRSGSGFRSHVVMMVMMMMNVVMMMVVMVRGSRHRSGSSGRGVLRHGVAGQAERENGRGRKGLDHGRIFLWLANPYGSARLIGTAA
jgi:hypothetical protein